MTGRIYLWVALGGGLGGVARYWLNIVVEEVGWEPFWGTLTANLLGSFAIGFGATLSGPEGRLLIAPHHRQFFLAGFCGGFTTFSFFMLDGLLMELDAGTVPVLFYFGATIVTCLVAAWLGHAAACRVSNRHRR